MQPFPPEDQAQVQAWLWANRLPLAQAMGGAELYIANRYANLWWPYNIQPSRMIARRDGEGAIPFVERIYATVRNDAVELVRKLTPTPPPPPPKLSLWARIKRWIDGVWQAMFHPRLRGETSAMATANLSRHAERSTGPKPIAHEQSLPAHHPVTPAPEIPTGPLLEQTIATPS
jgi:hypothetical protein